MGYCGQYLNGISSDCSGSVGGITELWISSHHNPLIYTIEEGVIKYIYDGTTEQQVGNFQQYQFKKGQCSMTSTLNKDNTSGLHYVSTDIKVTFKKVDSAKRIEIEKLINATDLVIIAKDGNGKYWLVGNDYPCTVNSVNGNFGATKKDANNFSVTFNCCTKEFPLETLDLPWTHGGRPRPPRG